MYFWPLISRGPIIPFITIGMGGQFLGQVHLVIQKAKELIILKKPWFYSCIYDIAWVWPPPSNSGK